MNWSVGEGNGAYCTTAVTTVHGDGGENCDEFCPVRVNWVLAVVREAGKGDEWATEIRRNGTRGVSAVAWFGPDEQPAHRAPRARSTHVALPSRRIDGR